MQTAAQSSPSRQRAFAGHVRVASLLASRREDFVAALAALPAEADAAEIRLDGLWHGVPDETQATDDLADIADAARVPLVATLRPRRQGGGFEGPENVRVGLLLAAARAGFSLVDLEVDVADAGGAVSLLQADANLILSHHDLVGPPCREDGLRLLLSMKDRKGALDKLAFGAHSYADALRALELMRAHAERGGRPAVSALGFGGAPLRALMALAGNCATYGHAGGFGPAAPGQPSLAEVAKTWREWGITKADLDQAAGHPAPFLAVLGTPVGRSLSPAIHNAALRAAGRPERFGALEVPASPAALRLTFHVAARIGLFGASITHPHKGDAARIAAGDEVVRATGSANCVRFGAAGTEATNTDASALRRILRDSGARPDMDAMVLGSGGAARSALWALRALGVAARFAGRDEGRARATADLMGAERVPWERRNEVRAGIWVQATAVGLHDASEMPIDRTALSGTRLAVELNYAGGPTAFQTTAAAVGAHTVDGRTVLVEQATDAYRYWFGTEPEQAAMQRGLAQAVA